MNTNRCGQRRAGASAWGGAVHILCAFEIKYLDNMNDFPEHAPRKDTVAVPGVVVASVLGLAEIPKEVFSVSSSQPGQGRNRVLGKDPFRSLLPSFISYEEQK